MTTKSQTISGATMESVAELVEEFCQRVQAGESLDAGTFAAEHPLCALALAEVLPAVEALAAFGELDSTPALLAMGDEIPESRILGDYLIKREVGRGGMGIVFEAEQASLGRRVAVQDPAVWRSPRPQAPRAISRRGPGGGHAEPSEHRAGFRRR